MSKKMTVKEFENQYSLGSLSDGDLIKIARDTKSKTILTTLSKDKSMPVKAQVYLNKNTPKEIQDKLVQVPLMGAYVCCALPNIDIKIPINYSYNHGLPRDFSADK